MHYPRIAGLLLLGCMVAPAINATDSEGKAGGSTAHSLAGTDWNLANLAGDETDPALPAVTLRFEADNTLNGFDGCNHYRGSYSRDGTTIHIPPQMAATRAACPEPLMQRADAYSVALTGAASFSLDADRLTLYDATGQLLAAFEKATLTLAGSLWEVISYNNGKQAVVSLLGGTHITLNFGQDGRLTGSAGCNRYSADYRITDESIEVSRPASTRRLCSEPAGIMDQETRFLDALASARTLRLEGERLTLRRADGAMALNLDLVRKQPQPAR